MPSSSPDPSNLSHESPGRRCAGCPGCEPGPASETPDSAESDSAGARPVLGPLLLFLLPIALAILGAVLGNALGTGELLGGLLGLAAGMTTAVLVARAA